MAAWLSLSPSVPGHQVLRAPSRRRGKSGGGAAPPIAARRHGERGWTLAFAIERAFVYSRLAQRLGSEPAERLAFTPRIAAAAAEIRDYCILLVEAVDRGIAKRGRAMTAVLEAGLVDLLLELQPHSHGVAVVNADANSASARVSAVAEFVDAHAAEPLSIEKLARKVECSVRQLQLVFARQCGMSPMEFVRRRRLLRARELLGNIQGAVTVADVAAHVGFSRASHFASSYRAFFGEPPSETIRRVSAVASQSS